MKKIPSYALYNPTLQALHKLGGSATIQEIHDEVVAFLDLSDKQINKPYGKGQANVTDIWYRLGWVRTWMKRYGLLKNSSRGVWALTPKGRATDEIDGKEVERVVDERLKQEQLGRLDAQLTDLDEFAEILPEAHQSSSDEQWRDTLYAVLKDMHPSAFERLCQLILRESGFTQVEVTGRTGDGGIDGIGVMRLGRFLSIRVLFQCKRYKGSIGAGVVRDFRGAMIGRTDKGLIVATANFTPAAKREATRDGAPEIDLVDGEQLIDKLKELSLGVKTEEVIAERVTVDPAFFDNI